MMMRNHYCVKCHRSIHLFIHPFIHLSQEWNVVKKNKFGRKQERVFGVDGKKVYNSKKGAYCIGE